jgi:hypothetical protein
MEALGEIYIQRAKSIPQFLSFLYIILVSEGHTSLENYAILLASFDLVE